MAYNLSNGYNIYPSNSHTPSNRYPFSVTQIGCLSIVLSPLLSFVNVLPSSRKRFLLSVLSPTGFSTILRPCPARQRCMVRFIGSLTLEPAGYHGRAHLQRRLYLVPSMYNISMVYTATRIFGCTASEFLYGAKTRENPNGRRT